MSFDLERFEKLHADVLLSVDPEAAVAALSDADRALFAEMNRDGLRIAAIIVARLRFERLIHGSRSAAEWFDRDTREFTRAFKRYHTSVPPTATFPSDEARAFEAWMEAECGHALVTSGAHVENPRMRKLSLVVGLLVVLVGLAVWLSRRSDRGPQMVTNTEAAPASPLTTELGTSERDPLPSRAVVETLVPKSELEIRMPTSSGLRSRIFGRVVDARGAPVAEAEVRIYSRQGPWSRVERLEPDKPVDRRDERLGTSTDALGKFAFDAPLPTSTFVSIEVTPSPLLRHAEIDCGSFGERPPITQGDNDVGDLLLQDGCALTGRVVDESGKGIADASLIANIAEGEHRAYPVESDKDGLFTIPNLAPGARKLSASATGRRSATDIPLVLAVGETKQVDAIVLAQGSTIAGIVVDPTGVPIEGVWVRARATRGNSTSSAVSDAQGAFRVTLNADDPHTLSIGRSESWAGLADPLAAKVEYEPGRADVRLVVKPSTRITFRVTSAADGSPIERFGLELRRKLPSGSTGSYSEAAIEDHPGGVVALAADLATQMLFLDAPGFAPVESDIVLDAGSTDTQTFALAAEGVIVGRVFVGNAATPGARVAVMRESWRTRDGSLVANPRATESNSRTDVGAHAGRERTEVAGADGAFRFGMLTTGTYALVLSAENGAPGFEREIGVVAGRTTDVGQIELAVGGTLRGRLIPPPEASPLGYGILIDAVGRRTSAREVQPRQLEIAHMDGTFEFRGLAAATYSAKWILPGSTSWSFSEGEGLPQAVVTAGNVAEIILDASNTSPCTVAVRVLRRGQPFVGASVGALTKNRGSSNTWTGAKIGITDAEGRVEGRIEGGLRFRLQVYESERGALLLDNSEEIEAVPRGRIEREYRIETGTLVLVLPADLVPPEKGSISVNLSNPSATPRNFNINTPGMRPTMDRLEWKGSIIPLGPVAAGTYTVRVSMRRYDTDPTKPQSLVPTDLRPAFTADIEVRPDAETRIEVR